MADLLTNAQLAQLINDALAKWNAREAEQYAWVSGSATGGPNGDGRYPLSNGSGGSSLIDSPAKLADLLNGPAALAGAARDAALTFRDAAESAATAASTDKALANNHKLAAQDARDLAAQYRNEIAALLPGFNANASMVQAASLAVAADVDLMEALLEEGYVARDAAVAAQTAAEAAAALAATFNPNDYYTKVAADGRYLQLTNFTWANLSGKPSTFTPSAHTHLISEITGLQAALDGKQAAGSYAAAVHTHDYLPLTGGTLTGGLAVAGDVTASRSSTEGVLYLSSSGSKYLRYGDGVYGLAGADLYINGNLAWHGGNFNPASKADVDHTHNSTTGDHTVSGNLYLGNTDGSNLNAFRLDVYANDLAIVASSGAGAPAGTSISFRTATAGGGETERMRINPDGIVGLSVGLTVQGNPVWHSGNFDPNSKLNTSGGTMTGTLTMSSSPIILAFSGSLPYMDLQSTGVSGGRNYRIRSGIEGVSNGGFSIKDLTSGNNVLGVDEGGVVYAYNGLTVSGGAVYRADWTTDFQSTSDFVDGTLVTTNIPASDLHGDSFEIEITGKSYNAANPPMKVIAGGYLYNGGIIAASGISYGGDFADTIKVFEEGGVLKFWWPRVSYWNSFRVSVVASISPTNGTITRNRVTAISNSTEPTGTKKVTISLHRTIKSDPGSFTHINRPYANLLSLFNTGGTGARIQLADLNWSANIRQDSGNLMFQTQGETTRLFLGNGVAGIGTGNTSDSALRVLSSTGAGFRVGFNNSAENYYDAGYHAFRHTTGAAILEMYPSTIFAKQDLYALSGNIFVRENPSGAGAGMRLHHNGGGAYIDFDGDLNFRTGEGAGLVGINSSGGIVAAGITSTGDLRVGGYTSATGFTMLNNGTLSNPGYLAWYAPGGTRVGYMGWASGNDIVYQAEAGWGLKFNTSLVIGSTTLNGLSGTNTFTGFNNFVSSGNPQSSADPPLQAYGADNSSGAWMAFHRPGQYAINMGLDSGNIFRIGGWSAPSDLFSLTMAGNLQVKQQIITGPDGFQQSTYRVNDRNRIYSFGNADAYGLSYFQGSAGEGTTDVVGVHMGTATSAASQFAVFQDGRLKASGLGVPRHVTSGMTSGSITTSTAAPSGGSDGDIWLKVA